MNSYFQKRNTQERIDLEPLLDYMLEQGCIVELTFSDINVGHTSILPHHDVSTQRFYIGLPGYIEVEFFMRGENVDHLQVRQSVMTLREIEENGTILPNINIAVSSLSENQRFKVQQVARKFLTEGKLSVETEAQKTLMAMMDKILRKHHTNRATVHHESRLLN